MADLISSLPDEIICYILSFLKSREVVATSVLSKRWNLLWRSVPSLDFDTDEYFSLLKCEKDIHTFYSSVCSFLAGRGDQPFYRFRIRCYFSMYIFESIRTRIQNAVSESDRVQILDLKCDSDIVIPSVVFSFRTLVTLKLEEITVEDISFVDLPLLKILHLNYINSDLNDIDSPIEIDLSQLLSGCPNVEELKVIKVRHLACETKGKFIRLPKLVRASIGKFLLPLEIFKEVEVLKFHWVKFHWIFQPNLDLNFYFHNLVQLQLIVILDWLLVLKVLNHCPNLQSLVIGIEKKYGRCYEEDVWPYPQTVPACISSHLKTCRLRYYRGSKDEFHFARYILENAKCLRTMKFYTLEEEINDMKRELSSCMKGSDTCTLSFSFF